MPIMPQGYSDYSPAYLLLMPWVGVPHNVALPRRSSRG